MLLAFDCCDAFEGYYEEDEDDRENCCSFGCAGENSVVPGEDREFVKASDEVPASSGISGDEDSSR